jgi:tetratricopeptide (TPR) repeat protein
VSVTSPQVRAAFTAEAARLLQNESEPDAGKLYALGRQRRALQDDDGAEASYRAAIKLQPDFVAAWISLGILLRATQRGDEAVICQQRALELDAENLVARLNLGNALLSLNRIAESADAFRYVIARDPACSEAHNNLARALLALDDTAGAQRHFAEALLLNPGYFEAAEGLGRLLAKAAEHEAAIEPLRIATQLRPRDIPLRSLLGRALSGAGRYDAAIAEFETVLRHLPGDPDTRYDLALAQFYSGQYTKPRAALEALMSEAEDDFVSLAYSSLLLRAGEYRKGWQHYGARWKTQEPGLREFAEPMWQGESLAGKTLLILREQGLGDEIMFASIVPELIAEAGHCIIECEDRLVSLYRRTFPAATIFGVPRFDERWYERLDAARTSLPRFDCWVPLGDLGRFRRNEPRDFPRHEGYLRADPARVDAWRQRFAAEPGTLHVGIGWCGGTKLSRAGERSLTLDTLRPLLSVPGVRFVSVQYGPWPRTEIPAFATASGLRIEHFPEAIDDIEEYAAMVSALDLVISVCSAVIHLGGALGQPTWVLAPLVPEWRYGREGHGMIWYPGVRMFRQDESRSWSRVVSGARRELTKFVAARSVAAAAS